MSLFQMLYDTIVEGNEKYGANTWQDVDWEDHLKHAEDHVWAAKTLAWVQKDPRAHGLVGDSITGEDLDTHLRHALTRLIYTIECRELQEARHTPTPVLGVSDQVNSDLLSPLTMDDILDAQKYMGESR